MEMKGKVKMRIPKFMAGILLLSALFAISLPTSTAQNSNNKSRPETTLTGYISDSLCGLHHMRSMENEKECTLTCVKSGSKFVLADKENHKVYKLDKTGQDKAREFAGQKVKITGRLTRSTIQVTSIEPAG